MIFVVGASRSGTTMMGRILNQHSKVFTFKELHFFEQIWNNQTKSKVLNKEQGVSLTMKLISLQRDGYFRASVNPAYLDEANSIWQRIDELAEVKLIHVFKAFVEHFLNEEEASLCVEQTPRNVFYVNEIRQEFESPLFIHMIRDPRDVMISQRNRWKRRKYSGGKVPFKQTIRQWVNYHPITMNQLWLSANNQIEKNEGVDYLVIRFEDMILKGEEQIKRICSAKPIAYQDGMLNVPQVGSSVQKDQGKIGIDKSKISTWKKGGLNNTELYLCEKASAKFMQKYGYEKSGVKPNYLLLIWYYLLLPFQLFIAFLFSLKRVNRIGDSIRRRLK